MFGYSAATARNRCPLNIAAIGLPLTVGLALAAAPLAHAQDNYEIQVYGSETVAPNTTMVELHSNFTVEGSKTTEFGVLPTKGEEHETLEITRGFTPWFETGFYVFSSIREGEGWQWVGDHIRPRVRVPEAWQWPLGLSLSTEVGYQQRKFSEDTWTLELRPIIDKQWGPWYFALNPALERSLKGLNSNGGFEFAPNVKLSYDLTKVVTFGVEYYGSLGPVDALDTFGNQQHQIFPALDLNFSPKWEFNFGVGWGLTHSTDGLIVKMIIGRRF
jgi:hypothetical protein